MGENKGKTSTIELLKYLFICFSIVVLSCAVKNFFVYLIYDTESCKYLCPAFFGQKGIVVPFIFQKIFDFQSWLLQLGHVLFPSAGHDKNLLFSTLVMAPVVEECMYRGPLFLFRRNLRVIVWWALALLLSALFALSHRVCGLSLLPLLILGVTSSWLLFRGKKFWPCLALHFLYNFYVISYPMYQSLFWGD